MGFLHLFIDRLSVEGDAHLVCIFLVCQNNVVNDRPWFLNLDWTFYYVLLQHATQLLQVGLLVVQQYPAFWSVT